jgi:hypothetical protein
MRARDECPDCGAFLQDWTTFQRCPWAKGPGRPGDVITCGRPYTVVKRTEISAPIHGRRTD